MKANPNLRFLSISGLLIAWGVSGCIGVPQQQLIGFATSFSEAQSAGLLIYDEVYPIVRAEAGVPGDVGYPLTLGPSSLTASPCEERYAGIGSLVARCHAFTAAVDYNEALLALAQGAPTEAVIGQIESALTGVTALAAAVGSAGVATFLSAPAAEALTGLLKEALRIRDRAALKAKLDAGAPHMAALLDALQEDANRVYKIARASFEMRLTEREDEALRALGPIVQRVQGRSAPQDSNTLVAFRAAEARLDELLGRDEPAINPPRVAVVMESSGASLIGDEVARITDGIAPAEAAFRRFDSVAAEWRPFRESIIAYRDMLLALDQSFSELIAASSNPFAPDGATVQLAQAITNVREKAAQIEELLE